MMPTTEMTIQADQLTKSYGPTLAVDVLFFFSSRRRHTRWTGDWSSDVCSPILIDRIKREPLARSGTAEPAGPDDTDAIEMVACGHPIENNEVRIVDGAGRELGERQEGMLEFRGPSITKGYFRNEEKTRELFHDGWVKSGDRAYIVAGDIYITGRVKDIIIRGGRNTYPQEIEEALSAIPGIRKGGVAAFGSPDPENGTERLIVMAETKETDPEARAKLIAAAHEVVTAIAGSA